jgi:hypothetical protein
MNPSDADKPPEGSPVGGALFCIAVGLYLLAGAIRAFAGTWPVFLPPQLDGVAALLSWLPKPYGTYAAGAVTGLLGLCAVALGITLWSRPATRGNPVPPDG